jgi:uncharacterized protein YjcR
MARQSKKVDWSAVQALATSGIPLRELARRLNIPASTVLQRAKRGGWNISALHGSSPAKRHQKALEANELSRQTVQVGRDFFQDAALLTRFNLARATANVSTHLASMPAQELVDRHHAFSNFSKSASLVFGWDTDQNQNSILSARKFSLKPFQVEAWAQREREGWSLQQIERYLNNLSPEDNARLQNDYEAKYANQPLDIDP